MHSEEPPPWRSQEANAPKHYLAGGFLIAFIYFPYDIFQLLFHFFLFFFTFLTIWFDVGFDLIFHWRRCCCCCARQFVQFLVFWLITGGDCDAVSSLWWFWMENWRFSFGMVSGWQNQLPEMIGEDWMNEDLKLDIALRGDSRHSSGRLGDRRNSSKKLTQSRPAHNSSCLRALITSKKEIKSIDHFPAQMNLNYEIKIHAPNMTQIATLHDMANRRESSIKLHTNQPPFVMPEPPARPCAPLKNAI